jgi:tryptophan halogenase
MSDDEAASVLVSNLESESVGDPRLLRFTAGQRTASWSHNCVALGLSAGFMEPLESTSIHLIQSAVARLLTFLPQSSGGPAARDTYNRVTVTEWAHIRDFLVLHYKANGRVGEPFWDENRAMAIPDSLSARIALFREAAIISREESELFTEEGWGQVMIGQGLTPRSFSPLAAAMDGTEVAGFLSKLAASYRLAAEQLPHHAECIEAILRSKPPVPGAVA